MKYRKKPIVVEAVQWTGDEDSLSEVREFLAGAGASILRPRRGDGIDTVLIEIPTPEGNMFARLGDYIIRGIANEVYPCKPDIFAATYEAVSE